jgi:alkaline phosphatase D
MVLLYLAPMGSRFLSSVVYVGVIASISACGMRVPAGSVAQLALKGAPMWGHVDMRSAWLQVGVTGQGKVTCEVWTLDSVGVPREFQPSEVNARFGTAKFELYDLEPGTRYAALLRDGTRVLSDTLRIRTQVLWDYRMDPPPFKLLAGSCAFLNEPEYDRPGRAYGGEYGIFTSMAAEQPDMMLWLGDNIYLREVDFGSISGYRHRYDQARALPELKALWSACPHYAIWDDHDYGPNDCDGAWIHKDWALDAFKAYWPNPGYGVADRVEGIATAFRFSDVDFFLLDNRWNRVNAGTKTGTPQVLGSDQIDWLIASLRTSRAPFKLIAVGGQVLSDAAIYENLANYPSERNALLERIAAEGIRGVVFLTGDRHNTELTRAELPGGLVVYDLTLSPLTSTAHDHTEEPNTLRVPETMVGERNYGVLTFSGPRKDRVLGIQVKKVDGAILWERTIRATELASPR